MKPSKFTTHPVLSRAGTSNPIGKLDDFLEKMRINGETKARLQMKAAAEGMPLQEYVRMRLDCDAWGAEHLITIATERIRRVSGNVG